MSTINRKLGRNARTFNPKVPHMKVMLGEAVLPPLPESVDWTKGITEWGAFLNDSLGCCTVAGYYHIKQILTLNSGTEITEPDSCVLQMYEEADGYVQGNPDTDQGGVEQNVLSYLLNTGAPTASGERDKILAFVEIDPSNHDAVKHSIWSAGSCYIGFNVPNSLMANGDPAPVWNVEDPDGGIEGGHAICICGFNSIGYILISWGSVYLMSYSFWEQYVDECYMIVSQDWIEKTGKTPLGMTIPQLETLMSEIKE